MSFELFSHGRDLVIAFDVEGRTTYRSAAAVARTPEDESLAANTVPAPQRDLFRRH